MNIYDLCQIVQSQKIAVCADSRKVKEGDVFIALAPSVSSHLGKLAPKKENILDAMTKKAKYIVAPESIKQDMVKASAHTDHTWIFVEDTHISLGLLAQALYDTKSLPFPIIAITGTNGKTTTAYILEHLYAAHDKKVGVLGTVSYRWEGFEMDAPLTTPDCLQLHHYLHEMHKAGVEVAIMEVSSHALDQGRVVGIDISGALFTNLTQDHLDYHENMENYFQAKSLLFSKIPKQNKVMSINFDDAYGQRLLKDNPLAVGFGLGETAEQIINSEKAINSERLLKGTLEKLSPDGLTISHSYQGKTWKLNSPLVGEHNASNLLAAQALALQLGFSVEDLSVLESFHGVNGRLERVQIPSNSTNPAWEGVGIFVDYAHTPDALVNALTALRKAGFARLITVFGCGGDRDRTKRPLMGEAVAKSSDIIVLTSDNPRTEDPEQIMNDVVPGFANSTAKEIYRESDRKKALALALSFCKPGDALLVAGKGHETYQIIGTKKYPFSDFDILKELLLCV